jgi:hypothetical protein
MSGQANVCQAARSNKSLGNVYTLPIEQSAMLTGKRYPCMVVPIYSAELWLQARKSPGWIGKPGGSWP